MNINPTAPQGPRQQADAAALETGRATDARQHGAAAPPTPEEQRARQADSVDVSNEAQSLARQSEARSTRSSLPPERAREIGERLASGFYDQPEVIEQVAKRVAADPDFLGRE